LQQLFFFANFASGIYFMRLIKAVFIIVASGLTAQAVFADSLYSFDSANRTYTNDLPATLGFLFSVKNDFTVTSLGWFDDCLNGFQDGHTVRLFDVSGTLLAAATLSPGTVNPLSGSFRYEAIAPVTLTAGSTYLLAGTTGDSDPYTVSDNFRDFGIDPNFMIAADAGRYADNAPGFVYPDQHYSDYMVYAGPNLDGLATPEPGSFALLAVGCAGLMLRRRIFPRRFSK